MTEKHGGVSPPLLIKLLTRSTMVLEQQEDGEGNVKLTPLWKVFGGNNRFCCGGRIMYGPSGDQGPNCCAHSSITFPVFLLLYFGGVGMWAVSPALPLLIVAAYLWSMIALLATTCRYDAVAICPRRAAYIYLAVAASPPSSSSHHRHLSSYTLPTFPSPPSLL